MYSTTVCCSAKIYSCKFTSFVLILSMLLLLNQWYFKAIILFMIFSEPTTSFATRLNAIFKHSIVTLNIHILKQVSLHLI